MKNILCSLLLCANFFYAQFDSTLVNRKDTLNLSSDIFNTTALKTDTLIPLFNLPNNKISSFISQEKIKNSNYRYFGDIALISPSSNIRDYGFVGYPNTISLYGNSSNSISILKDGLQINERYMNYFNLNLLQTEEIDSVEIIPLPRGALYSSYINPTSINIITKDFLPSEPYSRIRYYQGPDREAFVNGYFNAEVLKKLFLSFSVTNRIKDATYQNSEFSIWQGNFKLKYLLSNQLNLIFSYDINDYKLGFNGGVDYDSLLKLTTKPEDLLYDPIGAPVLLPDGEIKLSTHLPRLTVKSKFFDWLKSDLSLFYLFNKSDYQTNQFGYLEDKVWGLHFDNKLTFNSWEVGLILDYEKIKDYLDRNVFFSIAPSIVPFQRTVENKNSDLFTYGGYLSLKPFSKKFVLSVFYKNSRLDENIDLKYFHSDGISSGANNYLNNLTNSSAGIDLFTNLTDRVSLYVGYSVIGKYLQKTNLDYLLFESAINYKDNFIDASFRYFINEFENIMYSANPRFPTFYYSYSFGDLSGISTEFSLNYKFILLESKTSYYWSLDSKKIYNIPTYQSRNGFYYYDYLFNNNLDLKAGIVLNLIGNQISFSENRNRYYSVSLAPVQTIDFSLSGTIQKKATLYFIWENLLNKRYILIPYYPMPERNIRFGVSWEFFN